MEGPQWVRLSRSVLSSPWNRRCRKERGSRLRHHDVQKQMSAQIKNLRQVNFLHPLIHSAYVSLPTFVVERLRFRFLESLDDLRRLGLYYCLRYFVDRF